MELGCVCGVGLKCVVGCLVCYILMCCVVPGCVVYKYVCVWVCYVVQTFITHLRGILCDAVLGFESVFDMVLG